MEELHQQTVKAAQDALGEDCYAALFRDGAGRRLDLVVTLAVTDADELPATPGCQRPAALLTGRERQIAPLVGEGGSSRAQLATGLSPTAPSPDWPPPPPGPPGP